MSDLFGDLSRKVQQGQTSLEDAWRQAQAEWLRRQQQSPARPAAPAAAPAYRPAPPPLPLMRPAPPPPTAVSKPPKRPRQRKVAAPPPLPSAVVESPSEVAYGVVSAAATARPTETTTERVNSVVPRGLRAQFVLAEILKPPMCMRDD